MTGTEAQSRHNECTTPGARGAKSDARFVPACDYQDRFTEPPHRATEAKQQGQGRGSPILVPGNVTERPTPGHPRQRPPHPAPVAQWIEQAPSKRLAAGSSPAGGALSSLSFGRAFLLFRAGIARHDEAPAPPPDDQGRAPGLSGSHRVFAGGRVECVSKFFGRRSTRAGRLGEASGGFKSLLQVRQLPVDAPGVGGEQHGDAVAGEHVEAPPSWRCQSCRTQCRP